MTARLASVAVVALLVGVLLGLGLARSFEKKATSERIVVIDVRNLRSDTAVRLLQEHGFTAGRVAVTTSAAQTGKVVSESPPPGAQVAPGTLVSLTVAAP